MLVPKPFDAILRRRAHGSPLLLSLPWFTHPRCRCHPTPEVAPMLYAFDYHDMPIHPSFGFQDHDYRLSFAGGDCHSIDYRPSRNLVRVRAISVAQSMRSLEVFYGIHWPSHRRPASYIGMTPSGPPPPDWPVAEPAAVCPECNGTGSVELFTGRSPCNTCGGGPCPSS